MTAAPTEQGDAMRAAFEHWYSDKGQCPKAVERYGDGYRLMQAQQAWNAWQAAWNVNAQRITELSAERDTAVRVFEDLCDAIGCHHDNEAALQAIAELGADVERLKQEKKAGFAFWKSIARRFCDHAKAARSQAEATEAKVRAETIEACAKRAEALSTDEYDDAFIIARSIRTLSNQESGK